MWDTPDHQPPGVCIVSPVNPWRYMTPPPVPYHTGPMPRDLFPVATGPVSGMAFLMAMGANY